MSVSSTPFITVLCGGCSSEREVSLVSGRAVAEALAQSFDTRLRVLETDAVPTDLDPAQTVIFPALHGTWGEDGTLQTELEQRGFAYAGCDPESSARCMDKVQTKSFAHLAGIPVVDEIVFEGATAPRAETIISRLGESLVLKPVDEGSSVGLHMVEGVAQLEAALGDIKTGRWMIEPRVRGREFAVGVLEGKAMGIVEIKPEGGVYDYAHKYTAGSTRYEFPASLSESQTAHMRHAAEAAFSACLCRDFARVDFMTDENDAMFLLEVNTIPGLTPTSLLPKSASCVGLDFPALARRMAEPALARWLARR